LAVDGGRAESVFVFAAGTGGRTGSGDIDLVLAGGSALTLAQLERVGNVARNVTIVVDADVIELSRFPIEVPDLGNQPRYL